MRILCAIIVCVCLASPAYATSFRGAVHLDVPGTDAFCTVTPPTGTTAGDLLIAAVHTANNTTAVTPPPGWTLIASGAFGAANDRGVFLYWKIAVENESAATWTWPVANNRCACSMAAYYGEIVGTPIESYSNIPYGTNDQIIRGGSITGTGDRWLLFVGSTVIAGSNNNAITSPTDWVEDFEGYTSSRRHGYFARTCLSLNGSAGPFDATLNVSTTEKHAMVLVLANGGVSCSGGGGGGSMGAGLRRRW